MKRARPPARLRAARVRIYKSNSHCICTSAGTSARGLYGRISYARIMRGETINLRDDDYNGKSNEDLARNSFADKCERDALISRAELSSIGNGSILRRAANEYQKSITVTIWSENTARCLRTVAS